MSIFNKFKKKFKRKKRFQFKRGTEASGDWGNALIVTFLAIAILALIGAYVFFVVVNKKVSIGEEEDISNIIDQELLNSTIELYTDKRELFEKYQKEVPEAPVI